MALKDLMTPGMIGQANQLMARLEAESATIAANLVAIAQDSAAIGARLAAIDARLANFEARQREQTAALEEVRACVLSLHRRMAGEQLQPMNGGATHVTDDTGLNTGRVEIGERGPS